MINLIIHRNHTTAFIPLPVSRVKLAEQLASVGIQEPPRQIYCRENKEHGYDISFSGDTEFERKLLGTIQAADNLANVNEAITRYESLPLGNQTAMAMEMKEAPAYTLFGFFQMLREHQPTLIEAKFYCPLTVNVFERDEYGYLDESLQREENGEFAARYEDEIRTALKRYTENDETDMAEYFDGYNSAVAKLKSAVWGVESVNGTLYGCITAKLTEALTAEEEESFKEWICGQNSDGFGEGFEQQSIDADGDEIFVSFWNSTDDYFIDNEQEFSNRIDQEIGMGGM